MIKHLDLANDEIIERVLLIQKLAYRIEADLIGFDGIPALYERIDDLRDSGEVFCGYFVDEILVGVLSYSIETSTLDICRLVVHPDYFRRGIGEALVRHVETVQGIKFITVSTGEANDPARKLYERLAYKLIGNRNLPQGISIVKYKKSLL